VLGKTEVAEAAWKQYYHKLEKLKEALVDRFQSQKISFIHLGSRGIEVPMHKILPLMELSVFLKKN
jgi:hypothetical protein